LAHLNCWLGVGCMEDGAFREYVGYTRPTFMAGGDPVVGRVERFAAPTAPAGAPISHGALFDTASGQRHLLTWRWLPDHAVIPGLSAIGPFDVRPSSTFAPLDIIITWTMPTLHALNASVGSGAVDKVTIPRGTVVGEFNGQPLTASVRLATIGGTSVARAAITTTRQRTAAA
jgi:hypothetical protein